MYKFLNTHEYVIMQGDEALIGISEYAAKQLGDVVYVEMPEQGEDVVAHEEFGAIESVKAASDLISPVSGAVVEFNELLLDNPALVNKDPMHTWIIRVKVTDPSELDSLMSEEEYAEYVKSL